MKELFIILTFYILIFVLHGTEAIREGNKWSKDWRQEQNVNTVKRKRNLAHKPKHNKRLKVAPSHEKNDASQRKRQFVPGMPFLNFPHPHIHRIIVHHHPGRSKGFPALLLLTVRGRNLLPGIQGRGVNDSGVIIKLTVQKIVFYRLNVEFFHWNINL